MIVTDKTNPQNGFIVALQLVRISTDSYNDVLFVDLADLLLYKDISILIGIADITFVVTFKLTHCKQAHKNKFTFKYGSIFVNVHLP